MLFKYARLKIGTLLTAIPYVTRSREMSHLSKNSISIFLHHFLETSKCFILMQTPLQLDNWLQSYEGFDIAINNRKQRNVNTVLANISKSTSPTSDSFLLIISHIGYLIILDGPIHYSMLNRRVVLPCISISVIHACTNKFAMCCTERAYQFGTE